MTYKLTKLLDILEDGKWHQTDNLGQIIDLKDHEVQEITDFLGKYSFVEVDENRKRMRINRDFRKIAAKSVENKKPSAAILGRQLSKNQKFYNVNL